jgi:cysteine desulfurase family protein
MPAGSGFRVRIEVMTIYLDNAATSHPKPETVYQAVNEVLRNIGANPGRSGHRLSLKAGHYLTQTRESLARLLDIPDPKRIVFTINATEAINLGLKGLLKAGDGVITSSMEHNSVIRPLRFLESQGILVKVIPGDLKGRIKVEEINRAIDPHTRLIVLTQASNVTGGLMPVAEAAELARRKGILMMADAAQTAGLIPLSLKEMPIDLLAAPGHKGLMGPQGTGFLVIGPEVNLRPLKEGGTGSRSEEERQPDFLPDQMESGTLNTPGLAGLGAGVEFILKQGLSSIRKKEVALSRMVWEGLRKIKAVELYGPEEAEDRVALVSFNIKGLNPHLVASILDTAYDIAVRAGLHCAALAHRTLGTFPEGTVRVSPGFFNREGEIEVLIRAVSEIAGKV